MVMAALTFMSSFSPWMNICRLDEHLWADFVQLSMLLVLTAQRQDIHRTGLRFRCASGIAAFSRMLGAELHMS